ncbi:MAG: hypothetical protein RLZZ153_2221 [Pseudomonadota bacterium]|jgi:hypothetical protein
MADSTRHDDDWHDGHQRSYRWLWLLVGVILLGAIAVGGWLLWGGDTRRATPVITPAPAPGQRPADSPGKGAGTGAMTGSTAAPGSPAAAGSPGTIGAVAGGSAAGGAVSGPGAGVAGGSSAPGSAAVPVIRYPIERALGGEPAAPMPPTGDTPAANDRAIAGALSEIPGREQLLRFAIPSEIVQRVVLTIDNLPADTMSMQYRAVAATPGSFVTERRANSTLISPSNAARYEAFVSMAMNLDARRLVMLYKRFYPLFQQEYRSIGYPNGYFNDRVVEAIDDLLATEMPDSVVSLTQPRVLFEYADPALERRSVGQRILIRMGPEHAARLKSKLREIRTALTSEVR